MIEKISADYRGFDPQTFLGTAGKITARLVVACAPLVVGACARLDALRPVSPSTVSQGPTPIVRLAGDAGTPHPGKVARPVPSVTLTPTPEAAAAAKQKLAVLKLESKAITQEDENLFAEVSTSLNIQTEGVVKEDWNEVRLRQDFIKVMKYIRSSGVPRQVIRDLLYNITIIKSNESRWYYDTRIITLDDPHQLAHEMTHVLGMYVKPGEDAGPLLRNSATEGLAESVYLALHPDDKSGYSTTCKGTAMIDYGRAAAEIITLEKKFPDLRAYMIVAYWQYLMNGEGYIMPFDKLMQTLSSQVPGYKSKFQKSGHDMTYYFDEMPVLGLHCGGESRINSPADRRTVRADYRHDRGPRLPNQFTIYPRKRQYSTPSARWA